MKSSRSLAAALAAGALIAIPAAASAAPSASAHVSASAVVTAQTVQADKALDRALAMFTKGADRAALNSFHQSRMHLAKAMSATAKLTNKAKTDKARAEAAKAWGVIAMQRDENLAQLVKIIEKVNAKTDKIVAKVLLADTKHRDVAISVIQDLINAGVTPQAEAGLNRIIAALSTGRAAEIGAQVGLLTETKLPEAAQQSVAIAIQTNVAAQARVAAVLDELIPQLPEDARAELEKALKLVKAQLAAAAEMMEQVTNLLPPFIRPLIEGVLHDIQELVDAITAPLVSGEVVTPPEAPATETPVPGVPTIPGVEIPQVPMPFPIPLPDFVLDIINSFLPGGLPMETSGFQLPFVSDFLGGMFGEGGFLGGFFGGGSTGGGFFG
jgi:hypothetical protein